MFFAPIGRTALGALAAVFLFSGTASAGALEKLFAPKPDLWPRWTAHSAGSKQRIDHGSWDRFLSANREEGRDGVARVRYGRVSAADRRALDAYIDSLAAEPISGYSRDEQFAYWVNLYNALTVKTVLDHYPVASIRDIDISSGLFADGPWRKKLVEIEGESVSLDDIEHRILRPIWKDPRIHYAVNCASIGCPNLPAKAFTAANKETLMSQGARDYVNHSRGARVSGGTLTLSSIYSWFEDDFARDGGVLSHVRRYARPELASQLEGFDGSRRFAYDWDLNDAGAAR